MVYYKRKEKEAVSMGKIVTVEKYGKWWYTVVREEGKTENLILASFSRKKIALECRDKWAKMYGYMVG